MNFSFKRLKGWLMLKVLSLIGLVISGLVFLLFTIDLLMGFMGSAASAPFQSMSLVMDLIFMIASGGLAYTSWTAFREQR